jgi:hypothetical protein
MPRTLEKVILDKGYLFVENCRSDRWISFMRIKQTPSTNTYAFVIPCNISTVTQIFTIMPFHEERKEF